MFYSEIFNTYKAENNVPFLNILKKVQLPKDKTSSLYKKYIVPYTMPWVTLSYLIYNDLTLYWIILLANDNRKLNPFYVDAGEVLYIVKPEYISLITDTIANEI